MSMSTVYDISGRVLGESNERLTNVETDFLSIVLCCY